MSNISNPGEESTRAEIECLTNLTNLAAGSATQAIRKTGTTTFANLTVVTSDIFVSNETPSGTIDDANRTFTLAYTPVANSQRVFMNGQRMAGGGVDYTATGATLTFVVAPGTGSIIIVDYLKA